MSALLAFARWLWATPPKRRAVLTAAVLSTLLALAVLLSGQGVEMAVFFGVLTIVLFLVMQYLEWRGT